jgi:hypothetical protein
MYGSEFVDIYASVIMIIVSFHISLQIFPIICQRKKFSIFDKDNIGIIVAYPGSISRVENSITKLA